MCFLATTSDFSNDIDTLAAWICFCPDEDDFVECRLVNHGHWPCEGKMSMTLIPQDYLHDNQYHCVRLRMASLGPWELWSFLVVGPWIKNLGSCSWHTKHWLACA